MTEITRITLVRTAMAMDLDGQPRVCGITLRDLESPSGFILSYARIDNPVLRRQFSAKGQVCVMFNAEPELTSWSISSWDLPLRVVDLRREFVNIQNERTCLSADVQEAVVQVRQHLVRPPLPVVFEPPGPPDVEANLLARARVEIEAFQGLALALGADLIDAIASGDAIRSTEIVKLRAMEGAMEFERRASAWQYGDMVRDRLERQRQRSKSRQS